MPQFNQFVQVGTQELRCGYTTGTCATAGALAGAMALATGDFCASVMVDTPAGVLVEVEVLHPMLETGHAQCAICKDGGDDPDITHGHLIVVDVEVVAVPGIHIVGGSGVGVVTRNGLDQSVGQAAINSVPRQMITKALTPYLTVDCPGLQVTISVPDGQVLAAKTFNPRLGIVGGISILGTSGLVRPMSEAALMDTIALEIKTIRATGTQDLLLTPGNYGRDFSRDVLGLSMEHNAICSNYLGHAIDCAQAQDFASVLVVGHLGKLAKVAAGAMQTHSKTCDGRREVLCTHTALCGGDRNLIGKLYESFTTDEAVSLLQEADLLAPVMASMADAMDEHLGYRGGGMAMGAVFFSNRYGILGQTAGAAPLLGIHEYKETQP